MSTNDDKCIEDFDPIELFTAVKQGQIQTVLRICKSNASWFHAKDSLQGNSALMYASVNGNVDVAKVLLKVSGSQSFAALFHLAQW
jgi:hypothetical protein